MILLKILTLKRLKPCDSFDSNIDYHVEKVGLGPFIFDSQFTF